MERALILRMLSDRAREGRINAECAALLSEESGFREFVMLEEELQRVEHVEQGRMELHQLRLGQAQQQGLDNLRSQVVRTCGLDAMVEEEMNLHSSIQLLQGRLGIAEEWLETFNSCPTVAVEEKMRSWQEERKVIELQLAQLRMRIAKLNEEPVVGVSLEPTPLRVVSPTPCSTKYSMENAHIGHVTERTKEILSRARELLL